MHEAHMMMQIVQLVEDQLRDRPESRPTVIRLKISPFSHLAQDGAVSLERAFALVAAGTRAQGAALDVIHSAVQGHCQVCGRVGEVCGVIPSCSLCGSGAVRTENVPEVVLHELVVEE